MVMMWIMQLSQIIGKYFGCVEEECEIIYLVFDEPCCGVFDISEGNRFV